MAEAEAAAWSCRVGPAVAVPTRCTSRNGP